MLFAIFIQFAVRSRLCLSETHDDEECWSTTECAVHTQRKSSCGSSLLARREIALVNRPKLPASSHSIVNRCTRVCERLAHNTILQIYREMQIDSLQVIYKERLVDKFSK